MVPIEPKKKKKKKKTKQTHHTSVVLEVKIDTIRSPPGLALADNNGRHDLLPQFRLSLLDGGHDHVTHTSTGQTVQTGSDTLDRDDVQVTRTGVVAAVEDGSTGFVSLVVWEGIGFRFACSTYVGRPMDIFNLLPAAPPRLFN